MHEKHLYEYAVIRYLPRVERDEFINVGLVLMCKRLRRVLVRVSIDRHRFDAMCGSLSLEEVERQLSSFGSIAAGDPSAGPIAGLPAEERFRWLTAVRSACIQTSRPHPGITDDIDSTFERLFAEQVL